MIISAPAKINRYLFILDRLPDGYHQILTMFEKISLFDHLHMEVKEAEAINIQLKCPDWLSNSKDNLIYQAAQAFCEISGLSLSIKIEVEKNIPAGGGLGGGSSDAAATLTALNKLTQEPLSRLELQAIGSRLGADIPFFVSDWSCAIGTGTGTQLEKVEHVSPNWYVLVFPEFSV
ncbi:MAG: 4-(cytidine 5'-diphospho)-2-C-methyl-D-erythritol kinase, partial [Thermodesulfatator sp.]